MIRWILAQTSATDASVWVAVVTLGVSIVGGAVIMAWRLGGINSSVRSVEKSLDANTRRLDVIEAKAEAAATTATAATAAISAVSSTLRRRSGD